MMMRITPASKECKDCLCVSLITWRQDKRGCCDKTQVPSYKTHTHTHPQQAPYFHEDFEHVVPLLIIQEQSTIDRLGR
jgi:hypothetical protein